MLKQILLVFCIIFLFQGISQTAIIQEDFSSGIPAGWQVIDEDGFTPHSSVSQFTDGWIWYTENNDSSVASTSYFEDTVAVASDYLILPKVSLDSITKLSWDARSVDASYPDGFEILISTTDSSISSFTDTVFIEPAAYFQWSRNSVILSDSGYFEQDVFIAFHHSTIDGFILELDNIWVETSDFANVIDHSNKVQLNIYPNPVTNKLNIKTDQFNKAEIYTLNGSLILESTEQSIPLNHLDNGMYLLKTFTKKGIVVDRFIKK